MDWSPPGSSVHEILQARLLEWVAIPFSRGSSWPRNWTQVSCIAGGFFTIWDTRKASVEHTNIFSQSPRSRGKVHGCLVTQLCPTLCDSMDCSPPGSSVQGMFQARILEWVAVPFSRGSNLQLLRWQTGSLPPCHLQSPKRQGSWCISPPVPISHWLRTEGCLSLSTSSCPECGLRRLWGQRSLPAKSQRPMAGAGEAWELWGMHTACPVHSWPLSAFLIQL